MTITPSQTNILVGMTATLLVTDVPVGVTVTVISSNPAVASVVMDENALTVTALTAGSATITVTAGLNVAMATVSVTSVPAFTEITNDGSGTGDDSSLFGRQYIINQNLKRISTFAESLQSVCDTIKTLSITNQVTNAATLAGIVANIAIVISSIRQVNSEVAALSADSMNRVVI